MSSFPLPRGTWLLVLAVCLVLLPGKAAAFGAGNIPSIAQVEGHNWRHGDIEDMLASVAFLHGKKWTSMLIKRTYFGNWLRDYSQAVDVGSLKGVNAATIRILASPPGLVWVLSFMAFGYATEEFEVTEERLGCYRPEEHIDNPLGYADGLDARTFDPRLRGPVEPVETEIDMKTGMKNYIANETGQWATSAGYIRFSFARSIHFGRLYTCGERGKGKDENLCEALRCLGQALHCLEDFGAHSNYCELALRELGYHSVFPHCGTQTEVNIQGKRIYPIVTGTFGAVDFLHSVIGEANDHFTQSEVDEVEVALKNAQGARSGPVGSQDRGLFDGQSPPDFISLLSKLPDVGAGFASEARELKESSEAQERENQQNQQRARADNANVVPGMSPDFDPVKTAKRIYPILVFRDNIVKAISRGIAKVPGLEKLLEHISETLTAFVLGLLAPFIRPIVNSVSKVLKDGSSGVISASSKSQLEPWENDRCSDPTHSMLSKDHFINVLNSCAGRVAATILQYAVPRVIFAWENPNVPVDEVVNDVIRTFHHPALRNENIEIQRDMFKTVRMWADQHPRRHELERILSSEAVRTGKNHILHGTKSGSGSGGHSHGGFDALSQLGHGKVAGSLWSQVRTRDLDSMSGNDGNQAANYVSNSPAPESSKMPTPPSYAGGEAASYLDESNAFQAGYNEPPPPGQYYQGYSQQAPGGAQGYPGPQQQYGAPPPGQWQQPPQGYGGPGYSGPPPQGYPPYGQAQPPSWNQYPGQGRY
ncbi:Heterokaryon incompatibility protein Het-C [Metarhizium album ARSEF 1941]|uniref:Heterokaryon incompatibility protein Het-C n=1 Tax=Metarhizium album (strain ARSEF 1941) TaxID=1081103 RepID=A0A0B2X841_METAS|nr:Heterokaryon incompatibility protein Het-C [Metarhizium album ARSEF 1941]KHO01933.1 Heterokaryon incompatibility protein Het-C [Metarhizium album ARSEF 1941]